MTRPRIHLCSLLLLGLPVLPTLPAQGPASLVKDLNVTATSGALSLVPPGEGELVLGIGTFFVGTDPMHGTELWLTDGTTAGTRIVKDVAIGTASSNPDQLTVMSGILYFTADDGRRGRELWRSDGTPAGTLCLQDLNPGPAGSTPRSLYTSDTGSPRRLYFSADDGTTGRELHFTTGVAILQVVDAFPGSGSGMTTSSPITVRADPTVTNFAGAYFAATNGTAGEELWQCGSNGTRMCQEIRAGATGSAPRELQASFSPSVARPVVFVADDGVHGRELWWVKASASGADVTSLRLDFHPGAASSDPQGVYWVASNRVACSLVHPLLGREFAMDDVDTLTWTFTDLEIGSGSSSPVILGTPGIAFPILAATTAGVGREVWACGFSGPVFQLDIYAGAASSSPGAGTFGLSSCFPATDPVRGRELWNVTASGVIAQIPEIRPGAASSDPAPLAGLPTGGMLVMADDGVHGRELWFASATNVSLLKDVNASLTHGDPRGFAALGDLSTVLFQGNDGVHGAELWRSDGTTAGTFMVKDIQPGVGASLPVTLTPWNGKVYFVADDGVNGSELWSSDGTALGTVMVKDIQPGAGGTIGQELFAFAGFLWFAASDGVSGTQLWRTDGTTAGTVLVKIVNPSGSALPRGFAAVGATLYFTAFTAAEGAELWRTDGTTAGTVLVKDVRPGTAGSTSSVFGHEKVAFGGKLYFRATDGVLGDEMWTSDGTAAGTAVAWDLYAGSVGSSPAELTVHGAALYFSATSSSQGRELFRYTTVFPFTVRDIEPGAAGSDPRGLTVLGSKLLFHAETQTNGRELWITDGTIAGTVMVKDVYAGPQDGVVDASPPAVRPVPLFTLPGAQRALFVASDGTGGAEIWRTDGTSAGTVQHTAIAPGAAGSQREYYGRFGTAGSKVFFAANDGVTGYELYAMTVMASFAAYAQGCAGTAGLVPRIDGAGTPHLGSTTFAITCDRALPSTPVALQLGFGPLDLPLGNGCRVLFDFTLPFVSLPGTTDTRGAASFGLVIPRDRNLEGLQLFAQAIVVDPRGAYGQALAFSDGLRVVLAAE